MYMVRIYIIVFAYIVCDKLSKRKTYSIFSHNLSSKVFYRKTPPKLVAALAELQSALFCAPH